MYLYELISLPVPVNSSTSHATQLLDLPKYLAVTHHQQFYTTFNTENLASCSKHSIFHCDFNIALTPITSPSCVIGLFANNKQWVKKNCDFRFLPDLLKPQILELSYTSALVYNSWNLALDCPQSKRVLPGCAFCVLQIPCQCSISTVDLFYAARLVNCHNKSSDVITVHPINLGLLQQFFEEDQFMSITGDSLFKSPISVLLPEFKFYQHQFSQYLADDRKSHLSLNKMVQAAKGDNIIFKSLVEPLADGEIPLSQNWPDLNATLVFVNISITVIVFLAFLWTFFRLRSLAATLVLLQQANLVKSASLPSFIFERTTTAIPQTIIISKMFADFSWNHASVIIEALVFIILISAVLLFYSRTRKFHGTKLLLEITSGGECVTIPVMRLPLCPSYFAIEAPTHIGNIELSQFPSNTLYVQWTGFKVTNKLTNQSLEVKPKIDVGWFQHRRINRIMQQPFTAYILVLHQGFAIPLPFRDTQHSHNYLEHYCI